MDANAHGWERRGLGGGQVYNRGGEDQITQQAAADAKVEAIDEARESELRGPTRHGRWEQRKHSLARD